jgi:cytochrome c-type biogenesis protein CcmH
MITASSMQASDDRAETIGQGLICMCGCHQLLSGCEMINCSAAPPMRKEVRQHIEEGKDDKTILAAFREKYGPKVLSAPKTDDLFNLSAWLMPFAVFGASALAVIFALKKFKATTPAEDAAAAASPSPHDREIEEELKKFTPED